MKSKVGYIILAVVLVMGLVVAGLIAIMVYTAKKTKSFAAAGKDLSKKTPDQVAGGALGSLGLNMDAVKKGVEEHRKQMEKEGKEVPSKEQMEAEMKLAEDMMNPFALMMQKSIEEREKEKKREQELKKIRDQEWAEKMKKSEEFMKQAGPTRYSQNFSLPSD